MKNSEVKNTEYALQSTVNGSFFMKSGNEKETASSVDFDSEEIFESEIKKFDTKKEAEKFIEENEMWALEVVSFNS